MTGVLLLQLLGVYERLQMLSFPVFLAWGENTSDIVETASV